MGMISVGICWGLAGHVYKGAGVYANSEDNLTLCDCKTSPEMK